MALPIKRLRWVLAAGALLLVVVVGGYIGYGRYRALLVYTGLLKRSGAHISHDTNGFTYSQTEKGRTVYTLHAATVTQVSDGNYDLHGVDITLYGRVPGRADRIFGNEFTYDEKQGIVRAIGEVHIDLQVPQSLAASSHPQVPSVAGAPLPTEPRHEPEAVIHVRTSGLVYLRKLGVAATDQPVEFHFGGLECTALGAEFNSSQSTLRLLADVAANGLLRGKPVMLTAAHAEVDRVANVATLSAPRAVVTQTLADPRSIQRSIERTARADQAVLNLRTDGSLQAAKATGHVLLTAPSQQLTAAQLDATFNNHAGSQTAPQTTLQTAHLSGGVQLADTNALRPLHGSASVADLLFDDRGEISSVTAVGLARFSLSDKRDNPRGLLREVQGDRIVALFTTAGTPHAPTGDKQKAHLSQVHVTGSATARGESLAAPVRHTSEPRSGPQIKTTYLSGDDLQLTLAPGAHGHSEPRHLTAQGHTLLTQDAPLGERETSAGDTLNAEFAPGTLGSRSQPGSQAGLQTRLISALQTGHVVVHRTGPLQTRPASSTPAQEVANGTAERAAYDGLAERLTLSGNAHLAQDNTSLSAASITLDDRTQDADASGNVQAVLENAPAPMQLNAPPNVPPLAGTVAAKPAQVTHVLSASAHFNHDARQAEFHGTDTQPARIWQDASQVQAATLTLDSLHHTFSARPASASALIHAVFAGASAAAPSATHTPTHGGYVRVAAARMDYSEQQRQAVFVGAAATGSQLAERVVLEGDAGTIHAERAVAYLVPAPVSAAATAPRPAQTPVGGSLQRVVITGDVELDQPGRHGTGDELVYTVATGDSVLTGSVGRLPRIVDAQQGSITGPRLLFGDAGSTIIVSGESNTSRPGRVHTETQLEESKPGKSSTSTPKRSKK